ncbi:MAG: hypothetical protein DSM106950_21995 [Stigonema ocellatum SAG 48.90 = DSM 106950]|nr:hypothetical protein [Stigonema ocellatum SAG 48.90 = DSM 106950]
MLNSNSPLPIPHSPFPTPYSPLPTPHSCLSLNFVKFYQNLEILLMLLL